MLIRHVGRNIIEAKETERERERDVGCIYIDSAKVGECVFFSLFLLLCSFHSFFATAATQTGDSGEAKLKALQESLIEKVKEFQLTVDICYFYFGIVSDVDIAAASQTPSGSVQVFRVLSHVCYWLASFSPLTLESALATSS